MSAIQVRERATRKLSAQLTSSSSSASNAQAASAAAAAGASNSAAAAVPSTSTDSTTSSSFLRAFSDLSAPEVDTKLRAAVAALHQAESNIVLLFYEMIQRQLFRRLGYGTIQQYASLELGFSTNRIYHLVRLATDLQRLPRLRQAVRTGIVGWTKAREVTLVASPETEKQWIDEAIKSSRRQLEEKVQLARNKARAERKSNPQQGFLSGPENLSEMAISSAANASTDAGTGAGAGTDAGTDANTDVAAEPPSYAAPSSLLSPSPLPPADGPVSVTFRFTPLELARFEALCERIRKSRQLPAATSREEILLQGLHCLSSTGIDVTENATNRQSLPRGQGATNYSITICECRSCGQASVQTSHGEKLLTRPHLEAVKCDTVITSSGERNHRTIPPSTRRDVLARDRYRCQAPGCRNTRFLEVHHLQSRANGGNNKPENLITLCSRCHQLWHERGLAPPRL